MSEVGFFPKYEQKENRVTNYTLLLFKQIYNENPSVFQEFIENLLSDDSKTINVGVNFTQQEGYLCDSGKSIIDGVISQLPFTIFIETKNSDWFYKGQLERHVSNLKQLQGQKIFLALANFDGLKDEQKWFADFVKNYQDKDLIIKNLEFEELKFALDEVSKGIKSEILSTMIKEYEQFLSDSDLLPTWKYRLDVVNCAKTKEDVLAHKVYICPEAKGAYKHARSKYFGIYENKTVNCISEIKAVCTAEYDEETKKHKISISWFDKDNCNESEILKEAEEKSQYCWDESLQMFLLDNFREDINFQKDTPGGMFGSKIYFNLDSKIKNIDDLADAIRNQTWDKFQ